MIHRLLRDIGGRALALLAAGVLVLAAAPLWAGAYTLSVLTLILWFAYVGQAWNVLTGFAGQLSLGHALFVGLGGYVAGALFVHAGVPAWLGLVPAVLAAAAAGAVVGWLGFRFGIGGVHFALLTIAFAEFTRIGFDNLPWVGASGGLFLPVTDRHHVDLLSLRGPSWMFYEVILVLTGAALLLCRLLLHSRLGYRWLAVREDADAAAAAGVDVFRAKMAAILVSAALAAPAGVFDAFYYNNLFPEQTFATARSIQMILAPIVGGVGTLFGPVLGAFLLTPLGEALNWLLGRLGLNLPGAQQLFYGLVLVAVVLARPEGVWPWLARRLGLARRP